MTFHVSTAYLDGLRAHTVDLYVEFGPVDGKKLSGDGAQRERRVRVAGALKSVGATLPAGTLLLRGSHGGQDLTHDLAGSLLDLPVAVALLAEGIARPTWATTSALFLGELGHDGTLRPGRGLFAILRSLAEQHYRGQVIVPVEVLKEAEALGHYSTMTILGARSLAEVMAFLEREGDLATPKPSSYTPRNRPQTLPIHPVLVEPLAIVAATGMPLLTLGETGRHDGQIAHWLRTILPGITVGEHLECASIYSVAGLPMPHPERPIRMPHHSVSHAGMFTTKRGALTVPGEVSLAHHGVLLLSDVAAFHRGILADLVGGEDVALGLPRRPRWVGTSPWCYCGATTFEGCARDPERRARYLERLMDLPIFQHAMVVPLVGKPQEMPEAVTATKVSGARQFARDRALRLGTNVRRAEDVWWEIDRFAPLSPACKAALDAGIEGKVPFYPGMVKLTVKRIARALADFDARAEMRVEDVEKALTLGPRQLIPGGGAAKST